MLLVPLLLLLGLVGYLLATVNTDTTITIGSGPPGSSSHGAAVQIQRSLQSNGFTVDVVTTVQTSDLIDFLADPDHPVDVTFVGEAINPDDFPEVTSLGTVGLEPMLFGAVPGAYQIDSLAEAKGATIDLGPRGSVQAEFTAEVLAEFGVTSANSTFLHLPPDVTVEELLKAGVEVVSARATDPRNALRTMVTAGQLKLIPLPEARAIAGRIPSAEVVTLPIGSLQISPPAPSEPIPAIGQLGTVVADRDVSPAAAYAIAREMTRLFSPGDEFSLPGEFPNFADRQLPINPFAADFYETGTVPWHYANLPPLLADSFVSIIVVGTLVLVFSSIYSLLLPEVYSLWNGVIKPRSQERYLAGMEAALAEGRQLSLRQRKQLSEILEQQDAGRVLRQRADNLRPLLSPPFPQEKTT